MSSPVVLAVLGANRKLTLPSRKAKVEEGPVEPQWLRDLLGSFAQCFGHLCDNNPITPSPMVRHMMDSLEEQPVKDLHARHSKRKVDEDCPVSHVGAVVGLTVRERLIMLEAAAGVEVRTAALLHSHICSEVSTEAAAAA
eukprot:CAMPEP_0115853382 /NCGR_PEP_ID=MMETSP0287-20121206/13475_1 /TAXON_ID=412157 /ORGANISM="Chrysochromulina rotalis, Strain UIO044" /LENGTH=139 /DNA_ID=CAMNT_0003307457 /DNA_START=127 /DNA_END=546 /DNA_ORIENTATION=+